MRKTLKHALLSVVAVLLLLLLAVKLWLGAEFTTTAKILLNTITGYSIASPSQQQIDQRFKVPPGFRATVYASDLGKARMLAMSTIVTVMACPMAAVCYYKV